MAGRNAAARQEPDLAYGEAAGLKRGRFRPPRELVYAADASPGSRGTIIAAIFIRCPAQRTLLTFGLFNSISDSLAASFACLRLLAWLSLSLLPAARPPSA